MSAGSYSNYFGEIQAGPFQICAVERIELCPAPNRGDKRIQPRRTLGQCKVFGREAGPQSKLGNDEDWLIGQD